MRFTRECPAPVLREYMYNDDFCTVCQEQQKRRTEMNKRQRAIVQKQRLLEFSQTEELAAMEMFHFDVKKAHDDYFKASRLQMATSYVSQVDNSRSNSQFALSLQQSMINARPFSAQTTRRAHNIRNGTASDFSVRIPRASTGAQFQLKVTSQ